MRRSIPSAFIIALAITGFGLLAGCSKAPSTDAAATATTAATTGAPSPSTPAITQAASNFLDAVIKGDTQRAGACLTPQAMQRIIASGKPFAPRGMENATFKVGEVRTPAVDKAFVRCVVTEIAGGKSQSEEMCCLLRFVENEWRVSGIAYWAPNQGGTMSDFETGQITPIPGMQPLQNMASQPGATPAASSAVPPPRVATEPGSASPF